MSAAICPKLAARARLYEISDELAAVRGKRGVACARSNEWQKMAIEHRMAVLMLAGLDGDLSALAAKQWREFTPDEKLAIQVTIRSMYAAFSGSFALRTRV